MKNKKLKIGLIIAIIIIVLISGVLIWYNIQISPVDKNDSSTKEIEIVAGTSTEEIVHKLKSEGLIRNEFASKVFIKLDGVKSLQAGKYALSPSMNADEIFNNIACGKTINEQVTITFVEGKNMRWIASKIAEETNNTEEDVYNLLEDEEYIKTLIDNYWFLSEEITDENIYYPLEGYLCPNTYNFSNADVTVKEIFEILLNQTGRVLEGYKDEIESSSKSVHEILTIASIIELEGNDTESRQGISSVIYNRLEKGMSLGSDVTTYYAVKKDVTEGDLTTEEINTENAYNTRGPNMSGKLPVGPIASVSESSIKAALNPSSTDYLYFVSDIYGNIHFTSTYEEHQQLIKDLQSQGLWYEY